MSLLLISVKHSISSICLSISVTISLWSTWVYIVMAYAFLSDTYILVCYIRQQEKVMLRISVLLSGPQGQY